MRHSHVISFNCELKTQLGKKYRVFISIKMKSFCFIFGVLALCNFVLTNETDDLWEITKALQVSGQSNSAETPKR